jgi:hypothetical protein
LSILFGLEINASGGAQTVGEFKKVRQEMEGLKKEASQSETTNKKVGGSIAELASKYFLVTQALQVFLAAAKPAYDALIGQNVELQQQLLGTQASLAATNDVFAGGIKITDPTKAIQALEGPVNAAVDKIRKGSLELVGVTSSELIPIFQNIAGQSSAIGGSLEDSANLTLKFAATLGTLNVPLFQQRQEISSILQGTIDQNSIVAKTLNITNEQVNNWKSQGTLISELSKRLEPFQAGNKLAAQTISGVSSNIEELFQNITREAGKPLTAELAADLDSLFKFLTAHQDDIQKFVNEGVNGLLSLIKGFKDTGSAIASDLEPLLKELAPLAEKLGPVFEIVVLGLEKIAIKATRLVADNPALRAFLAIANGALTAVEAIGSLSGEYAAGTAAAEIYRQRSASVAESAIQALAKTKAGTADAAKARGEAIAQIDDELKSLKESNLTGAENRAVVKTQVDELEKLKEKLSNAGGAVKLVSKDTQQYTNQLKLQTEEYKRQSESLSANLAIQNAQLNQARASGLISEREFAARSIEVDQANNAEKIKLAQKRIDDISALQSKTNDPAQQKQFESDRLKAVTELASAQTAIAQKTIADQKRLQDIALQDLETSQKAANDAISQFENERSLKTQQLLSNGVINQKEADLQKVALTSAKIAAEIQLEQRKAASLAALKFDDPQQREANEAKVRESKLKTANLTLKLLETEREAEIKLSELVIKGIKDRADQQENAAKAQIQKLDEIKDAENDIANSIERQTKLKNAQNDIAKAQTDLLTVGGQIEIDKLNRAIEIRKRLNTETLDPRVRKLLNDQLTVLTGKRNESELELLKTRVAEENKIAAIKLQQLNLEQKNARDAQAIEATRNELAAKRLVIESQIAEVNAKSALATAQEKLAELQSTPGADPQAIANAAAAVKIAESNTQLASGAVANAKENLAAQAPLAEIAKRILETQQKAALAQANAAEQARQQAAALTLVEAKVKAIAQYNNPIARDDKGNPITAPVKTRRLGGEVAPGEPYLVGEEGPELIYPNRAGYVATARETAAMMAIPSAGIAAVPSTSINTRTLEAQSAKMVKLLGDANATLSKMATTKPVVPPPPEFPKEKPIFENWGGLPL